jgi:hypothetical protein
MTTLAPTERQTILRRLKRGPKLGREALAQYTRQLREEVLRKRKNAQA